jgi:hypothetical protein
MKAVKSKWLKFGGLAISGITFVAGLASEYIGRKNVVEELANSEEVKKLIAQEVAKALNEK